MQLVLTPELLLEAYRHGMFPMAYSAGSPHIHWICPEMRGQLSITDIHIPKSLQKTLRKVPYEIRINTVFEDVIKACAEPNANRPETWINDAIITACCRLHEQGHAHSVECWSGDELVGGLYGLAIGGAFFGESMFSREQDASKVALIHLCARLWKGGFSLLDTQFVNDHLQQFGVYEVSYEKYRENLELALQLDGNFILGGLDEAQILAEYLEMRDDSS